MACGKVYQFKVLCFGLSTAPQVFTRVMAPVSTLLHQSGIRLRRYLDDWLIQASSREQVLLALNAEPPALLVSGDSRQLGEVSACSNSTDGLSGGSCWTLFQGFSCPEKSRNFSQLVTHSCPASNSPCHLGWSFWVFCLP